MLVSSVITQRVAGLEDEMPDYLGQQKAQRAYDNACDCCDHGRSGDAEVPALFYAEDWTIRLSATSSIKSNLSNAPSWLSSEAGWTHYNNRDDK